MVCRNMGSSSQWSSAVSVDIIPDGDLLFLLSPVLKNIKAQAGRTLGAS